MPERIIERDSGATQNIDELPRLERDTLKEIEDRIDEEGGTPTAVIEARRNVKDLVEGNDFAVHDPETGETKVVKVTDIGSAALGSVRKVNHTGDPSYAQAMQERWEHQ